MQTFIASLLVVAVAGTAGGATPAAATTRTSACSAYATESPTNPGTYDGTLTVSSTTENSSGLPEQAIVSCWLAKNGAEITGTRITVSGLGAQDGSLPVHFSANYVLDTVAVCRYIAYPDRPVAPTTCLAGTWLALGVGYRGQN